MMVYIDRKLAKYHGKTSCRKRAAGSLQVIERHASVMTCTCIEKQEFEQGKELLNQ